MGFQNEKIVEVKTCKQCSSKFEITDRDLEFYEKVSPVFGGNKYSIPTPSFCSDCRQQRRLSYLNERKLYKNTCSLCESSIVARFNPQSGITVYCNECWASDKWDIGNYALEIRFDRNFFEQIDQLIQKTPFQNLVGSFSNVENNSIFTNYTADIHNSYLVFESDFVEDCFYSRGLRKSNNLIDCLDVGTSQFCYQSLEIDGSYKTFFSSASTGCRDSYFLNNCHGCNYCIGCINLINKEYHIFNIPVSKKEYEDTINKLSNYKFLNSFQNQAFDLFRKSIYLEGKIINSDHCNGNSILNSKNCLLSFNITESQDIKYCTDVVYSHDCMDVSSYGSNSSRMHEGVSVGRFSNNILYSSTIGKGENLLYCIDVKKSKNCFGCVNLKEKEYCILNKQYTKKEYNVLVPEIIKYMQVTGEWGEFFPSSISPFGYNETVAQEYFPLKRDEVIEKGFNWSDYEAPFPKVEKTIPANKLPDKIIDIPDDILNWAVKCEVTGKPFRIIKAELEFYRKHNLPIPRRHPDQRHLDRMALRNPRKLFDRKCDKCSLDMKTTYAPDRPEKVYCEECYNKEVY